jgi:hypothetical protein
LIRTPLSRRRSFNNEDGATSVAETPRSSGSRRLFVSKSSSSSSLASSQKLFPDEPDLLALMAWIRTFPQLHGLGSLSQLSVLQDIKVSLYVLFDVLLYCCCCYMIYMLLTLFTIHSYTCTVQFFM